MTDLKIIAQEFLFEGAYLSSRPYGNGHINDTFLLEYQSGEKINKYILQRMNSRIFTDVQRLMQNIEGVTAYIQKQIKSSGGNPLREALTLVKTKNGNSFVLSSENDYYRAYLFIEQALTYEKPENPAIFYHAGMLIGRFRRLLTGYDVFAIYDVIPDFHDTLKRFEIFIQAVKENRSGRAGGCNPEIDFVLKRRELMGLISQKLAKGELPLQVTHNDTKLNNMMFDATTGEGLCLIDLDTVMKGSVLYDFGEAVRFGCNTAAEDEADLTLVRFDLNLFETFTKGFLTGIANNITKQETNLLARSGMVMTLETGIRFLTDYLNGDIYYKIHREHHNLDRARNQFKLLTEMESSYQKMTELVQKVMKQVII